MAARTYDTADRSTLAGYTYDEFGRATAVPAGDAGAATTVAYFTGDLVQSITQNSATSSYLLDPARRVRSQVSAAGTRINHYAGDGDTPSWTETGSSWTRPIGGIDGDLAAIQTNTGSELRSGGSVLLPAHTTGPPSG